MARRTKKRIHKALHPVDRSDLGKKHQYYRLPFICQEALWNDLSTLEGIEAQLRLNQAKAGITSTIPGSAKNPHGLSTDLDDDETMILKANP